MILPVLMLGGTGLWLVEIGDPLPSESNPVVANIDEILEPGDLGLVVMGSSVTMAGIDAPALAEGVVEGRAISLAHRGGQPAHWLATLRHRMNESHRSPKVILLYVPLHTLDHGELRAEADRRLLVDLLTESDPVLLARGLGEDSLGGHWDRMQLGKLRVRSNVLDHLGRTPAAWLWGEQAVRSATLGQRQTPRDPSDRSTVTPGVPTSGGPAVEEPERVPFDSSFLPELVAESQSLNARLVVVVPALEPSSRRGPACHYNARESEVVNGLLAAGADVVDVSDAPIDSQYFETRQHLTEEGKDLLQPIIRSALLELNLSETDPKTPGRHWGCPK